MPEHILVSELFGPTIQGEGALAGQISHFIRTAGCAYRCTWCDSMHAVDPVQIKQKAERLDARTILKRVRRLSPAPWVTLTGGDPVAWDLSELIWGLKTSGFKIAVETQGALWHDWLENCDLVTCSPKPPSSGMEDRLDPAILQKYMARLRGRLVCKIVVFSDADLEFAEKMRRFLLQIPLYLTCGTSMTEPSASIEHTVLASYKWLAEQVMSRPSLLHATISPQMHVLLWGRELGR